MTALALIGQVALNTLSIGQIAIAIVIVAAIIALVYIALNKFGVAIPDFVVQIFWVLVVAILVILAIKFLLSMW